jgi:hypothetical protein
LVPIQAQEEDDKNWKFVFNHEAKVVGGRTAEEIHLVAIPPEPDEREGVVPDSRDLTGEYRIEVEID